MLNNEFIWLKEMLIKYRKNYLFYVWTLICVYIIWKLWYIYIFFFVYILFSIILLLIQKKPKLILTKKKTQLFLTFIKINILLSIQQTKLNQDYFVTWIFMFSFRLLIGVSYKVIKMSVSLFDCFYREYIWGNISKKKIKRKIILKYVSKSFENFLFLEFIKQKPKINQEINIKIKSFNKKISIIDLRYS